ncbi:FAD-binding oxidoreductase [Paroceanicella profunda]|uniref:FAD-binding oxidoreductase n=1 Tax=Paroceanicella profunda TaxID=2579971 RepID=A0A5B8FG99_9RHOB|nr:FAD-binding oxidoreductase [Paroceanicella profunda]QDL90588.1 FAD-binding oxidoreductase [Paroceanicella profunda]
MTLRVVIVGGGIMGASLAWWLTRGAGAEAGVPAVTVIERDPTLARASSMLSAASIRQQYSTPQNIHLSRFGWEFLSAAPELLGVDVGLKRRGYLILATETGRATLEANTALQQAEGVATALLGPEALARQFPWLSLGDIALGALGRDEGWFDPALLHGGFRAGARARGAHWAEGTVTGIDVSAGRATGVRLQDGTRLAADVVVNAAGWQSGAVAALAGQDLPVGPDLRTVFVLSSPDTGEINATAPLTVDPGGVWFRPEGRGFIAGMEAPAPATDPWAFEPDWPQFEESVWPLLAARVPAFERLRATGAWAGHYDWNRADQNALLGPLPGIDNLFHMSGFSGHGLQQAAGVGRGLSELILTGAWQTLDLSAFAATRLAEGRRVVELNVI